MGVASAQNVAANLRLMCISARLLPCFQIPGYAPAKGIWYPYWTKKIMARSHTHQPEVRLMAIGHAQSHVDSLLPHTCKEAGCKANSAKFLVDFAEKIASYS